MPGCRSVRRACRRSPGGAGGGPERGAVAQRGSGALRAPARGCARRARACWREPRSRARTVSGLQAGSGSARNRARAAAHWPAQGQRFGRCRVQRRAEWVSRPGESEVAPPERPGRHDSRAEPEPRRPAGEVVRDHLHREPRRVRGEAARGEMVEPDAVLEVADRVLDLGVTAMAGLQLHHLPGAIADEGVVDRME